MATYEEIYDDMGRYSSADYQGITLVSIYWHFVDLLWLYLYVFLSAIR